MCGKFLEFFDFPGFWQRVYIFDRVLNSCSYPRTHIRTFLSHLVYDRTVQNDKFASADKIEREASKTKASKGRRDAHFSRFLSTPTGLFPRTNSTQSNKRPFIGSVKFSQKRAVILATNDTYHDALK